MEEKNVKSMKNIFVVLCVLVAFTLAIGLVACKDAEEPSSTYLYVSATETGDKAYSANVSVEGEELTFLISIKQIMVWKLLVLQA